MIGRTIAGRYEVQGLLGKGGFGAVFAARHTMTGQDVVLKVMRPELALDPIQVKRFMNEARISSQLSHPNTVRTFDFGQTDDGLLYLVMERLHGDELAKILRRDAPLDPVRAMHIAIGVLKSLSEAHAAGLVHRDLKPGNIFLVNVHGEDDFVKLIDFGIAKSVEGGDDDLTRTGMAIGTPKYMSPEQGRAEPLDGRSDLYALGVILFEMLSARLPFEATSAMSMIVKHLQEAPPDLRTLAPQGVPPDLAAVVMRALKKSPWERFRDADEMREQIETILEGMGALHKRRTVSGKVARATMTPGKATEAAAEPAPAADQQTAAPTMDVQAARAAMAADETRALAAGSAPAKPSGGARPPSSAEVAALAAAFDREAAAGQTTSDVPAADELDRSTFVPGEAATASEAKAAASAQSIDAPARADVANKPPPGVRPQTPTRPAGPTTSHVEPRKPTPAWVFFLGFVVVAAVGGWLWWTQIASDEARAGVTREVAAARATVETKVNEPDMAKAGQRRKDHGKPKGSKEEPKTVTEKLKAAVAAGAEKVGEALPGGDEPEMPGVKPLESEEVDKVAKGATSSIKKCISRHGKPNTRYTRMGASLVVGKDGRVREAEAVADLAEGELATCVEAAFKRLRFRSGLDREQSIQAFVAFLPITSRAKARPVSRAGSAGDQPL